MKRLAQSCCRISFSIGKWGHFLLPVLIFLFPIQPLVGQVAKPDSLNRLTLDGFLDLVLAYHPIARQADLIPAEARQKLVIARGGFDPYFFSSLDKKQFSEKQYFLLNETGIKVPLWPGMEAKGAYSINRGDFLNPENNLPAAGQLLVGLAVPLGRGLITDERRTALNQAKIFLESGKYERIAMLNELLLRCTKDYWNWALYQNLALIYREAFLVSERQFQNVKNALLQGDVPALDTLEAFIQLQEITFLQKQAELQATNAGLQLSNHLWSEDLTPLFLGPEMVPESFSEINFEKALTLDSLNDILQAISEYHPEIQQLKLAIRQIDAERRLKLEYLKPKINLNYNLLSEQRFNFVSGPDFARVFNTNYKWGFDISFPLFWGKGRGEYQITRLKLKEAEYQLQFRNNEIANRIQGFFNEIIILGAQMDLFMKASENYRLLLRGEQIRFENGESSVFLLNARQLKLLEFETKLLEVKAKYNIALAGLAWASGSMGVE